jgi:hypothetical protein
VLRWLERHWAAQDEGAFGLLFLFLQIVLSKEVFAVALGDWLSARG